MKGRVKMFNEEKGYGFILGDDTNDYFVHITEVKSVETLTRGAMVEFEPAETERGTIAKAVSLSGPICKKPVFVEFGNTRIKLNNIKNYGISSALVYYAKVFEIKRKKPTILGLLYNQTFEWVDTGETVRLSESEKEARKLMLNSDRWYKRYVRKNGVISDIVAHAPFKDVTSCKTVEYLYVTTFQNDNHRFFTDVVDFNIHEKCRELDTYAV